MKKLIVFIMVLSLHSECWGMDILKSIATIGDVVTVLGPMGTAGLVITAISNPFAGPEVGYVSQTFSNYPNRNLQYQTRAEVEPTTMVTDLPENTNSQPTQNNTAQALNVQETNDIQQPTSKPALSDQETDTRHNQLQQIPEQQQPTTSLVAPVNNHYINLSLQAPSKKIIEQYGTHLTWSALAVVGFTIATYLYHYRVLTNGTKLIQESRWLNWKGRNILRDVFDDYSKKKNIANNDQVCLEFCADINKQIAILESCLWRAYIFKSMGILNWFGITADVYIPKVQGAITQLKANLELFNSQIAEHRQLVLKTILLPNEAKV